MRRERYRRLAGRTLRDRRWSRKAANHALAAQPLPTAAPPAVGLPGWEPTERLQVRCFGRFEVYRDGQAIQTWRRRAARTLLKYLVAQHGPVHRDVLLELLWPELASASALNSLRVTLHSLRRALAPGDADPIINLGAVYFLNPAAAVWVDADVFTAHFETGLRLERQAHVEAAAREYAAAEFLYRDDFLVEDLYEEWTVLRREELRDQYLLVLTKLAQYCLATGDPEGCIVRCHKLLNKEPCNEDAYQRLMRSYALLGQYGRAAHWYELCERTLRKELDVEPSPETRRLYRDIGLHTVKPESLLDHLG
jgi:DNA-binding SARP family transcriptional activator